MIKQNILISFKSIRKYWRYNAINVVGFALAISCFSLIYIYVSNELSYDSYHKNANRIYRLVTDVRMGSQEQYLNHAPMPVAGILKSSFPEVEETTQIDYKNFTVENKNVKYHENNILIVDTNFLSVFDFELLDGDRSKVLLQPNTAVLSKSSALKYFGKDSPVGKFLILTKEYSDVQHTVMVTGVMNDMPPNSHFSSGIIISKATLNENDPNLEKRWDNISGYTYLLLQKNSDPTILENKFPSLVQEYVGEMMQKGNFNINLHLEPLKRIYLYSKYGSQKSGSISNVHTFIAIEILILLIAAINYVNLSNALSSERKKEVAIKKSLGCSTNQLIFQFLSEAVILSIIAFIVACIFCIFLFPLFEQIVQKPVHNSIFEYLRIAVRVLIITIILGLISALYPSLVLASYKPSIAFKGQFSSGKRGTTIRSILVVFQFTISVAMMISIIIIYRQMKYMKSQPLGFRKDQMLVINFDGDPNVKSQIDPIRNSLKNIMGVNSVSFSSGIPGEIEGMEPIAIENKKGELQSENMYKVFIDDKFLKQYDINLIAGRGFSKDFVSDPDKSVIINEAGLLKLGYSSPQEIIGRHYKQGDDGIVVGVVRNFNFHSLDQSIQPLIFRNDPRPFGLISINISATNISTTIADIKDEWNKIAPHSPFDYYFVDQAFDRLYVSEIIFGKLILYFSIFIIGVSCVGLCGVSWFACYKRTKEIGIRKVLGSKIISIVYMLTFDFIKLIAIAILIASPLALMIMKMWLSNFAYKVSVGLQEFFLAGSIAIFISICTVIFQTLKAANAKPINSLKFE